MAYYDRDQAGDNRWFNWLIVLWMTILTWLAGQIVLTLPFPFILAVKDPEAFAQLMLLFEVQQTQETSLFATAGTWLLLGGILTGVIGLMAHYLGGRSQQSLWIGLAGVIATFVGLIPFFMQSADLAEANNLLLSVIGMSAFAYWLMLLTFPAALVGLYFGWKKIHHRTLTDLHTAWSKFRWGRVAGSFLIMWVVLGAYGLIVSQVGDNPPRFVFDATRFLPFAIVSLLFLPIQSATEEIVVRGYMNRGIIHYLGNKWVAFVLTSGLFMALHLANPEAQAGAEAGNLPIVMSGYFFFGFAACLMVLIDDGLESAIGVHAANNTFAGIFINYENSVLPTPSIWQVRAEPTGDALSTILILVIVLGLLWVTRRRTPQSL